MGNIEILDGLKSKDKKKRYKARDEIMKLSRSMKRKQKAELLNTLNEKSVSPDWEERYISMYGISRYMWRNGRFDDLGRTYANVLRLIEDDDGRVRAAARNALEHFRSFFTTFVYGSYNHFDEKKVVRLWLESLFLLWDRTKSMEEGKKQYHLIRCVDTLFRPDMEGYLTNKEYKKYREIWDKLQELDELYNEFGFEE